MLCSSSLCNYVSAFSTLRKINITSTDYMQVLLNGMTMDNIPKMLGGEFDLYNEVFQFDNSVAGPLWYQGAPSPPSAADSVNQGQDLGNANTSVANSENVYPKRGQSVASLFAPLPSEATASSAMSTASLQAKERDKTNSFPAHYYYLMISFSTIVVIYTCLYHYDKLFWLGIPSTVAIILSLLDF
jgi:hypothetical protein